MWQHLRHHSIPFPFPRSVCNSWRYYAIKSKPWNRHFINHYFKSHKHKKPAENWEKLRNRKDTHPIQLFAIFIRRYPSFFIDLLAYHRFHFFLGGGVMASWWSVGSLMSPIPLFTFHFFIMWTMSNHKSDLRLEDQGKWISNFTVSLELLLSVAWFPSFCFVMARYSMDD